MSKHSSSERHYRGKVLLHPVHNLQQLQEEMARICQKQPEQAAERPEEGQPTKPRFIKVWWL